ncbi:MAG TPA: hypothetical protein PK819_14125, partial [Thermomicrobiales bacterium]|nr:hypothetical protein [Thermomicrobiales bacterium]
IEGNGQVVAYVHASCGNRTAVLDAMYLPDRADAGIELVRDVIRRISEMGGIKRIYLVIRANQAELAGAMHDVGVTHIGDQDLAVRYTTAKVTGKPVDVPIQVPVEVRDRVPKRAPTFMNRPDIEEAKP